MNIPLLLLLPLLSFGPWESVGPEGGEVKAILQSNQDTSILYGLSGAIPTQVVQSTDNGSTWTTISSFTNATPYDLVMTANGDLVALGSSRTWTSTDAGLNWTSNYSANTIFYDGEAHPTDGSQVFSGGYKYDGTRWVISFFHSTDGGNNWTDLPLVSTTNTTYGRCVAVSESDPSNILVGGYEYTGSGYIPFVFKSTNGGASFTNIAPPTAVYYIHGVAVHRTNPNTILAGTLLKIFRSTDGGASWTEIGSQTYNYDISFSEADNEIVMAAGGNRLYRSTNSGQSWTTITSGLTGSGINWIEPDAVNTSIAYTGSLSGFFRSSDGGLNWTPSNSGLIVGKALAMEYVNGYVFMNMQDIGLFKALDGPTLTWEEVATPLACGDFCALEAVGPDTLLALEGGG